MTFTWATGIFTIWSGAFSCCWRSGYGWMIDAGREAKSWRLFGRRLLCILYGAAAALTLDEFALWLNLRDVYWAREGRSSLDAVVLFASFLLLGVSGAPLWRGLVRELGGR